MDLLILPQEGPLIHSSEDYLFLRGNVHATSTEHIVLASAINLALPMAWVVLVVVLLAGVVVVRF